MRASEAVTLGGVATEEAPRRPSADSTDLCIESLTPTGTNRFLFELSSTLPQIAFTRLA